MSCILFPRVSFLALSGDSAFQRLCDRASISLHGLGDRLFEINVRAYGSRYGNWPDVERDVRAAETDSNVDLWFMEYLIGARDPHSLLHLLIQIDYQYCEEGVCESEEYRSSFFPLLKEAQKLFEEQTPSVARASA